MRWGINIHYRTGIITNFKFNTHTALRAYGGSIYNSGNLNINNITITKSEAKSIEEIGPGYTYVKTLTHVVEEYIIMEH